MATRRNFLPSVNAVNALDITNNGTLNAVSRYVYIGAAVSFDFNFEDSTWVKFNTVPVGTVLPIQVKGARKNAGSVAPASSEIVFLY